MSFDEMIEFEEEHILKETKKVVVEKSNLLDTGLHVSNSWVHVKTLGRLLSPSLMNYRDAQLKT